MESDALKITVSTGSADGIRILHLSGPLTLQTFFEFQTCFRAQQTPTTIIDLAEVPYSDSAGLGALINAYVSCQNGGRSLALVAPNERILSMMRMTRVDQVFQIFRTLPEAEAHLLQ
jgi:anti-sigma B factor antagonist